MVRLTRVALLLAFFRLEGPAITVQTVRVPVEGSRAPVRVVCPVGRTTRLYFPEPLRQLAGPGRTSPLHLAVERVKPVGVVSVRPSRHPLRATLEFRGPTRAFEVLLETVAEGEGSEVRMEWEQAAGSPAPGPAPPSPEPTPAASPEPSPTPEPTPTPLSAPSPADPDPAQPTQGPCDPKAHALFDLDLLRSKPVPIGRREGLPGQRPMVLVDAFQGERWVWLRFLLEGGVGARVAQVSWERGPITACVQEPAGKDLRLVVQLPRAGVTRRTRLTVEVESGPIYTFALSSSSLASVFKGLFGSP